MSIRILKIALVLCVALQALFYGVQNIANVDAAKGFMTFVLSMEGHQAYPDTAFFALKGGAVVASLLWLVIGAEIAAGLLGIAGAIRMGAALGAGDAAFARAKGLGVWSAGLAVLLWFGLFMSVAGAFFQMWQTEAGANALEGAFMYTVSSGIVLIVLLLPERWSVDGTG